jgi:DNA-binding NarL/FixJ family response regulator
VGATASFAAAARLFDQIGTRLDRLDDDGGEQGRDLPAGLTEREAEVLRLVATGLTNNEIATQLFLIPKTVSRHLSNIFTKIGVSSRASATAFAAAHHLLDSDG